MAHRPEILRPWAALDAEFFGTSSLVENSIKEEARRTLAQGAGCQFCASLGTPREEHPHPREALAVAFAELIANDHHQIDENMFAVLREEFSEDEIVELLAWICFKLGSNIFGALMKLAPATPDQVEGYAAFAADRPRK
jgi:alkylhydroperoxidase family enzyme